MTHKAVKCLVKQFYLLTGVSNLQCLANSDKGYWFEMFGSERQCTLLSMKCCTRKMYLQRNRSKV